jgi:2-oxoglutarate dehydrogenase E2 component (dihydrolipoamide succinyltransferase)
VIRALVIPRELGEAIEVRLLQWYRAEGEPVATDDAVLEFETDKAIVLVTAKSAGIMRRCFCAAGDWMKPGDVAAWLSDEPNEPLPAERTSPADALSVAFETS